MIKFSALRNVLPHLLVLTLLLITAGDTYSPAPPAKALIADEHDHADPAGHADPADHADPESNRRMGIFHYNEGNKALREGNWEDAERNYKMALHHNERMDAAVINLSTVYLRMERYDDAYSRLRALEKFSPANPYLFYNLSCYYSQTHQIEAGLQALDKAIALGFKNFVEIQSDPDLENLRRDPAFAARFRTVR